MGTATRRCFFLGIIVAFVIIPFLARAQTTDSLEQELNALDRKSTRLNSNHNSIFLIFFFFASRRRPPISTLFPYTTLFRSASSSHSSSFRSLRGHRPRTRWSKNSTRCLRRSLRCSSSLLAFRPQLSRLLPLQVRHRSPLLRHG